MDVIVGTSNQQKSRQTAKHEQDTFSDIMSGKRRVDGGLL